MTKTAIACARQKQGRIGQNHRLLRRGQDIFAIVKTIAMDTLVTIPLSGCPPAASRKKTGAPHASASNTHILGNLPKTSSASEILRAIHALLLVVAPRRIFIHYCRFRNYLIHYGVGIRAKPQGVKSSRGSSSSPTG